MEDFIERIKKLPKSEPPFDAYSQLQWMKKHRKKFLLNMSEEKYNELKEQLEAWIIFKNIYIR